MTYRVTIEPLVLSALFDVRGDRESLAALFSAVDLPLPETVNSVLQTASTRVLRVGPRRCLIQADIENEAALQVTLKGASEPLFANATCVSDMYHALRIRGEDAADVLAQITPLDFCRLGPGSATACELFTTAGFLFKNAEQDFTLYFDSSYFDYALQRVKKCALVYIDE